MKHLYRSRYDKKSAGVCGGIGQYIRLDPTIIRLIVIFLCVLTAFLPIALAYIIACLLIPLEPQNSPAIAIKRLYRSRTNKKIAGICGGLSELLNIDATICRIVAVILVFVGFLPVLSAYVIGWIIIPERPK